MPFFDDPHKELNRLQEQLLEDEDLFPEEEEYDEAWEEGSEEEYEEESDEEYEDEPEEYLPPARSNRGLVLLALAELAGIGLIAAYWLRVFL